MKEESHSFISNRSRLFAVWHRSKPDAPVVLFHHGFNGNKTEAHRIFVKLARRLAEQGIDSFRFDFFGSGDSEGELRDATLTAWMENSLDAVAYLKKQGAKKIFLLGFSFGAFVAAATAPKINPEGLILWAPIFHPFERMLKEKDMLSEAKKLGYANLQGEEIGMSLMEDASRLSVPELFKAYRGDILLIHGSDDASALPAESERYKAFYQSGAKKIDLHWIPGANHSFDRPDWEKEVLSITAAWIAGHCST